LAGRWIKGLDISQYGSGNVGGNNAGNTLARWVIVPVGLFDIFKAAFPTWLAFSVLDLGYGFAIAAGLSATIGHNWSVFPGFSGGRGLGAILGALVIVFPWGALFLLLGLFVGWRLKSTAGSSIGLIGLPLLSLITAQPAEVTLGCLAMICIAALKRLEANRAPLPKGPERWPIIWRRIWLDRDIADHEEWLARRPPEPQH
jgi:glycerol-3-phosphate acyltransferase PlsY